MPGHSLPTRAPQMQQQGAAAPPPPKPAAEDEAKEEEGPKFEAFKGKGYSLRG